MAGKRVLFISYWPLSDVLTQAAIFPHLKLLETLDIIEKIVLVTIERKSTGHANDDTKLPSKVKHVMLCSRDYNHVIINKISDFMLFPKQLLKVIKDERVDAILASGTLAGAIALKVWQKSKTPFFVLYEPHADYMADSGVWRKTGVRYIFQKKWEEEQLKAASGLLVVSENYSQYLIKKKLAKENKIWVCRNPVNTLTFVYRENQRYSFRKQLNWQTATIGVYTGKYGGLYYNEEAFQIYQKCFELIPDFRLIILSPQPEGEILQQLQKHDIDQKKVFIASVSHDEVPKYLSAADFAFATYKPGPSKKYLSPVKVGEYWANGLPVLLTEGVGDESEIIKQEGGGALFNLKQPGSLERAIQQTQAIIQDPAHRQEIPALAVKYRSPERVREAYAYFFNQQLSGK